MLGRRSFARDDAISTVVSAVLVFSLVAVVFSIYMSSIVPDQVADAEAQHMRDVSSTMGDVAARISASASLGREGEFTTLLDLGTTTLPGISLFHSSGSVELQDNGFYSNFICDSPKVLARNGQAAPGGTYAALGGAPATLQSLSVLDLHVSTYAFGALNDVATLTVTVGGNVHATFRLTLISASQSIQIETLDAGANTVYQQIIESGLGANIPSHTVNALDPAFGFAGLLADSQGPFVLTTSSTTADIEAYGLYWTTDGSLGQIGDGRLLSTEFTRALNPVSLVYRAANSKFLDQVYSLEGGALALGSPQGEYLSLAPFSLYSTPASKLLNLSMVNLTGEGYATGSHATTLKVNIRDPVSSMLACTDPTILLSSEYAVAWHSAWVDALVRAGLSDTQATRAGDVVTVRLVGTWIVQLDEARVGVRIG